jgi:hypothetical protein
VFEGIGVQIARALKLVQRVHYCHAGARDGRRASATIGLYHVTIHGDRALTQQLEIQRRTQRAANQSLDFNCSPALLASRRLPVHPGPCRTRQHAVLRSQPPFAFSPEKTGYACAYTGCTDHLCLPKRNQY